MTQRAALPPYVFHINVRSIALGRYFQNPGWLSNQVKLCCRSATRAFAYAAIVQHRAETERCALSFSGNVVM